MFLCDYISVETKEGRLFVMSLGWKKEYFADEAMLMENGRYEMRIKIGDMEKEITFQTKRTPLYTTIRTIRSDYKQFFSVYSDEDILNVIHQNSLEVQETATSLLDSQETPYALKQYVRYKTELDLAMDLLLALNTEAGQTSKQLGEMTIQKQRYLQPLKDIIDLLQKKVDAWEVQAFGVKTTPKSAVRAGNTAYPLNARVSF